jgi:hypothetical protein
MREPALEHGVNASALNRMLPSRVADFLAAGHLAHQAVEQQAARTGLKAQTFSGSALSRHPHERDAPTQVDQQAIFARVVEETVVSQRGQRKPLAARDDVAGA